MGFASRDDEQRHLGPNKAMITIQIPVSSEALDLQGMRRPASPPPDSPSARQHQNAGFRPILRMLQVVLQVLLTCTRITAKASRVGRFPCCVLLQTTVLHITRYLSIQGPFLLTACGAVRVGEAERLIFWASLCLYGVMLRPGCDSPSPDLSAFLSCWRQAIEMRHC